MEAVTTEQVVLAGRTVPYTLTISHRARQPRLIITPGAGLRVVMPLGYDRKRLLDFMLRKQHWILSHLDRLAALPAAPNADTALPERIPFRGIEHRVAVTIVPNRRPTVKRTAGAFTVGAPDAAQARAALETWLEQRARTEIVARVTARAAKMALTYGRVTIRDQKTRWGSCSSAGNLNFNWRLILAPPAVLDYVVVHELAHRAELNHSVRFWRIVARYCPQYETHRAWLRAHGAALRF